MQTHDELRSGKMNDSPFRTMADGVKLSGGTSDETSGMILPTNNISVSTRQTNNATEMQINQCLPDLAQGSADRPDRWQDELKTAAAELPNVNKKRLNQTVQALFHQAKIFSNKGTDGAQTKSENAKPHHGTNLQKAGGNVSLRAHKSRREVNKDCQPVFHVSGTNGSDLIVSFCENRGWKRISDNNRCDYILKWCETTVSANFQYFQEGKQLLNQIPNNKLLTTKVGLCSVLKNYQQAMSKFGSILHPRILKTEDFYPETFRMDVRSERLAFFEIMGDGSIWISKPAGSNLGRGIFLLKCQEDLLDFRKRVESVEQNFHCKRSYNSLPFNRIVQRYVHKPLLLEGRKFDVRAYFLIACTSPNMVFFCHGYVKLSCDKYDPFSDDLTCHLTNQGPLHITRTKGSKSNHEAFKKNGKMCKGVLQSIQKKHPNYSDMKEDTVWSMEDLNKYINEKYMEATCLPKDWVFTVFAKRMQQIMKQCFSAVKGKLECKLGYFNLLGCDFIIDNNFKVWLLEVNANPSLQRHCTVLSTVIPRVVYEALDLVVEIFEKCSKGLNVLPLQSLKVFVLLYNGCHQEKFTRSIPKGTGRGTSLAALKQSLNSVNKPMRKMDSSLDSAMFPAKLLHSTVPLVSSNKLPAIQLAPSLCTASRHHHTEGYSLIQEQLKASRDYESFSTMQCTRKLSLFHGKGSLINSQQYPRLHDSRPFHLPNFNKMAAKPTEMKENPKEKQIESDDTA